MGRLRASVEVQNVSEPDKRIRFDALVDTGASHLVLPLAWRERLGRLDETRRVKLVSTTQDLLEGAVCGPVRIQVEGFEPIHSEVLFVQMQMRDGDYDPLLGYIPLEQCQAAVDMLGHRLVRVSYLDLK